MKLSSFEAQLYLNYSKTQFFLLGIMETLDLMKIDMANFAIQQVLSSVSKPCSKPFFVSIF